MHGFCARTGGKRKVGGDVLIPARDRGVISVLGDSVEITAPNGSVVGKRIYPVGVAATNGRKTGVGPNGIVCPAQDSGRIQILIHQINVTTSNYRIGRICRNDVDVTT